MSYPYTFFRPDQIEKLRERVVARLSEKRMKHVLAVENMAFRLGLLFFFNDEEKLNLLRAAALLHDVTKELTDDEQLAILEHSSVKPLPEDLASMPTIHALTAALIIPEDFPEFADPRLIDAVRYHTTGREGMTLCEQIVYLADYIDDSRTFPDCVALREAFWGKNPADMSAEQRKTHLWRVLVQSFDMTSAGIIEDGAPVSPDTFCARNDLILKLKIENTTEN